MKKNICVVFVLLFLTGCAGVQLFSHAVKVMIPWGGDSASYGRYKVGNPYKINGITYYPKEDWDYEETGIASWYGGGDDDFHGKRTANGEIYNSNDLTAAHRTLPMPSFVRVTNLENGRSLILRINDRGPFAKGRIIDISKKGAKLLGFDKKGTAKVRVQILKEESKKIADAAKRGKSISNVTFDEEIVEVATPAEITKEAAVSLLPVAPSNIYLQAGAFTVKENAYRLQAVLQEFCDVSIEKAIVNGTLFYRVQIGPVLSIDNADILLEDLISRGYKANIIVK